MIEAGIRLTDVEFANSSGEAFAMPSLRDSAVVLDRDFLEMRSQILDIAAALDRLDRAPTRSSETPDRRLDQLRRAIEALLEPGPGRAETVQRLFSLDYDPNWMDQQAVSHPRL